MFSRKILCRVATSWNAEQDRVNEVLVKLAGKYNVKIIASNDSHYVEQ
jgi:DNA polymerase III alpha subunit